MEFDKLKILGFKIPELSKIQLNEVCYDVSQFFYREDNAKLHHMDTRIFNHSFIPRT